jgi:hypothetical protein
LKIHAVSQANPGEQFSRSAAHGGADGARGRSSREGHILGGCEIG